MKKDFDCVEMKRRIQAKIYEEIKGFAPDQQLEYYRRRVEAGSLAELWKRLKTVEESRAEEGRRR